MDAAVVDFDQHDGVERTVFDVRHFYRFLARPTGLRTDYGDIAGVGSGVRVRRALKKPDYFTMQRAIIWPIPGFVKSVKAVEVLMLHERKQQNAPTVHRFAIGVGDTCRGKRAIGVVIVLKCKCQIAKIAAAPSAARADS